jgi:SAM-dependent methyltransferase
MMASMAAQSEVSERGDTESLDISYGEEGAEQYDWVADESLSHRYVGSYSITKACGDPTGLSVLDCACGNGAYLRKMLDSGAAKATGVDWSDHNLSIATSSLLRAGYSEERFETLQADLSKPTAYHGGPYDLILMNFAVCYASTFEELRAWTDNAFINLAPGGRLVLSNTRMALPEPECSELAAKFGIQYKSQGDGSSAKSFDRGTVTFPNGWEAETAYIAGETLGRAIDEAGFSSVEKVEMEADPSYSGDEDIQRLANLVPYDLFVATK